MAVDWKFILFIFNVIQFLVGAVAFCVIKLNDLAHIDKRLDKLSQDVEKTNVTVNSLSVQVSNISGYIQGQKDK